MYNSFFDTIYETDLFFILNIHASLTSLSLYKKTQKIISLVLILLLL